MRTLETKLRVAPKIWIGLLIIIVYAAIILPIQKLSGVPYSDFGSTADNLYRTGILSMAPGALALIIITTWLGWWRPALFENAQQRWNYKWTLIAPLFMVIGIVVNLFTTDWSYYDPKFLLILIVFGVLVGFCEELLLRGILITSLRSQVSEGWVCILSSVIFGLVHGSNLLLGQDIPSTISQVIFATMAGFIFYLVRRATGNIIWAMLLHGMWDLSLFAAGYSSGDGNAIGSYGEIIAIPITIIFLIIVFRKNKKAGIEA